MIPPPTSDYHDFVFREGKLVGEFEAMYQHSTSVPWHQDEQKDWIDVRLSVQMLADLGPFEEFHDFGCGLGHHLKLMQDSVGETNCRGFGYDVSKTACLKAAALFPENRFIELDLMQEVLHASRPQVRARRLFLIRGSLWYLFPQIKRVVSNLRSFMNSGET